MENHNKKATSHSEHRPLQVVIYDESVDAGKQITEAIRGAGYPVKATHLKDSAQLDNTLDSSQWDLIIGSTRASDAQLQRLARTMASRGADIPLLLATDAVTNPDYARALRAGARYVLVLTDTECARLAIQQALTYGGGRRASGFADTVSIATFGGDTLAGDNSGTAGGHDLLTGLFSHQYLMEIFDTFADQRTEGGHYNGLLYIKIDRFEEIHGELGDAGGGLVIADLGNVISAALDAEDIPIRVRDTTFAVLVSDKTREHIDRMATDLLQRVREHKVEVPGRSIRVTCGMGVALFGQEPCTLEEVISKASLACEVAQGEGACQLHIYDQVADAKLRSARESCVEHQIRDALRHDRFRMVFQPIVNLHAKPGETYEILLRMLDGRGHEMLPGEFMSAATHANLMPEIDRWVIRHGLERLKERQGQQKETRFFIKLDQLTLADQAFLPWLSQQLHESRITGDRLVFEICEGYVTNGEALQKAIDGLHELHCQCALEHVGRASNAVNVIRSAPVDYAKIDGSLTHDLATNELHQAKVKALIQNARTTGKRTIVTFVEDARSLSLLWRWGADFIQGHYVQRPDTQLQYAFEEST